MYEDALPTAIPSCKLGNYKSAKQSAVSSNTQNEDMPVITFVAKSIF